MVNPEKLARYGTQNTRRKQQKTKETKRHKTICVNTTMRKLTQLT